MGASTQKTGAKSTIRTFIELRYGVSSRLAPLSSLFSLSANSNISLLALLFSHLRSHVLPLIFVRFFSMENIRLSFYQVRSKAHNAFGIERISLFRNFINAKSRLSFGEDANINEYRYYKYRMRSDSTWGR